MSHSFIQSGTCDEFDRICKNCFCLLPHCSCVTPFNIDFEPDNFCFQETQHIQTYADIHENQYDKFVYSSTSESGGFQQKLEKKRKKPGDRVLKTMKSTNTYSLNMKMCGKHQLLLSIHSKKRWWTA